MVWGLLWLVRVLLCVAQVGAALWLAGHLPGGWLVVGVAGLVIWWALGVVLGLVLWGALGVAGFFLKPTDQL